jgi:hypothetical protein
VFEITVLDNGEYNVYGLIRPLESKHLPYGKTDFTICPGYFKIRKCFNHGSSIVLTIQISAAGGNRTHTGVKAHRILSPACIPVSPPRPSYILLYSPFHYHPTYKITYDILYFLKKLDKIVFLSANRYRGQIFEKAK